MENLGIVNTLRDLESSRAKNRAKAVDDLTSILKQSPELIPTKFLSSTAETLLSQISVEHQRYCSLLEKQDVGTLNKISVQENKFSTLAYLLRLFVEKTCSRFKWKIVTLLLYSCQVFMSRGDDFVKLLHPISIHFSYAILALLRSELFRLKYGSSTWVELTEKICLVLEERFNVSINDRTVSNLLECLDELLSLDTVLLKDISAAIYRVLSKYLHLSQKETVNTRLVLALVNRYIVRCHLHDVNRCIDLISAVWNHALVIGFALNIDIQRELSYCDVFASELVVNRLPLMVGHESRGDKISSTLQEYLTQRLAIFKPTNLTLDQLQVTEGRNQNVGWFEFYDFQLMKTADPHSWFNLLAIVKLLRSHYSIIIPKPNLTSPLFKRRRIQSGFRYLLLDSSTPEEFICHILEDGEQHLSLLALQVLAFDSSNYMCDVTYHNRLKELLLQKFDDVSLTGWTCLCLISLISQKGFILLENDLNRIFKLCLPLVKVLEWCPLSCRLLAISMKYSKHRITDPSTLNQIHDLYELSPINGPYVACNDAFIFWQYLEAYGQELQFNKFGTTFAYLLGWLNHKWDQLLPLEIYQNKLYVFLAWLNNRPIQSDDNVTDDDSATYSSYSWNYTSWQEFYPLWVRYSEERSFLLLEKVPGKCPKGKLEENGIVMLAVDRIALRNVFCRLLGIIENNNQTTQLLRFKWIIQILKLINCLAGDSSFLPFVEDFQKSVAFFFHSLDYENKTSLLPFLQYVASLRLPNVEHLILNGLNVQDMTIDFRRILDKVNSTSHNPESEIFYSLSSGMNPFCCCDVQIFIDALFRILEAQNEHMNRRFEILLDFLDGLKIDLFIKCLSPIMTFFKNIRREALLDPALLERFTRLISEYLLNKEYRASNFSMYWLSTYLDTITSYWLSSRGTSLNSDCNDILDWIISRFEDCTFSGVAAISRLSQLLLNMLKLHDSSRICVKGGKQKIFATFTECLKKLDKATVLIQLPAIIEYMSLVSYKNQRIIFSEVRNLFEPEQQSIEYSAFYTLAMLKFSLLSYSNLVLTLENMIVSARFEHTRIYIVTALNEITKKLTLPSVKYLFDLCKLELLCHWFSHCHNMLEVSNGSSILDGWDISLFGFESLEEFERKYCSEFAAFLFSRYDNALLPLTKEINEVTGKSEQQLLMDSYYMIVPLTYSMHGSDLAIGEKILNDPNNRYDHLLMYRWVLKYCDFGSLADTGAILSTLFPDSTFLVDLFATDLHTSRYQFPLHIPAESWSKLLLILRDRCRFAPGELHFLILWILADLEGAKFSERRLNCIRQIKFIVVSHAKNLSSCHIFSNILKILARLLGDIELHYEVLQLIICFLKLVNPEDLVTADVLSSLYSEIFKIMKDSPSQITNSFKDLSKSIANLPVPFSATWKFCDEIVHDMTPSDEIFQNDELLKAEDCSIDRIVLLSLMFSYAKAPDICRLKLEPSDIVVLNLLKYQIPEEFVSRNMELWTAYYFDLSGSARKISERLRISSLTDQNMSFRNLFDAPGSLRFLFTEFFDFMEKNWMQESSQVQFLWECVLCYFLDSYNSCREGAARIDDDAYRKYEGRRVPMSRGLFDLLHGKTNSVEDLEKFVTDHLLSSTLLYDEWLFEFAGSLLKELSLVLPDIMVFYHVCSISRKFSENVLTILFNLIIFYNPRKAIDWATRIVSNVAKLLQTQNAAAKTNSILKIVSMLRSGSRLNQRHYTSAYAALPLKLACEAALKTGQATFAYMLFEEFSTNHIENLDTVTLGTIYESLGDVDLMAGLPAPHTLIGALASINKAERNTWKSFLIDNANFNVNYYSSHKTSGRVPLLRAAESMGFYGLASFLGEDDHSLQSNDRYKWALQLGNWDLPIPESIDTKEKGIYYSLKKVLHDDVEPFKGLGHCLMTLAEKKKEFHFQSEWADVISNVSLLQRLAGNLERNTDILPTLKSLLSVDIEKLQTFDFEDYKCSLQSRHLFLSIISNGSNKAHHRKLFDIKVVNAILLAHNVMYSIENKSAQDALRYAFLIENLLEGIRKLDPGAFVLPFLERLGTFVSAEALWECKEFKTPVRMLEELLHHKINYNADNVSAEMKGFSYIPDDYIQATLVKWTSESRLETASAIFDKYIKGFETKVKDHTMRAKMFYILGNFLNDQVRRLQTSREIEEKQHRCDRQVNESNALEKIFRNASLTDSERKDAKRHHMKVCMQLENDMELLTNLKSQKMQFVSKALHYYLNTLVFTGELDHDVLDKFCGLWFEYDDVDDVNALLLREIASVPSWKFLPWVNQIASKLSTEQTVFQRPLQLTMKRLLFKLPYDSLYSIMSILFYGKQSDNMDQRISQKVQAVENLLKELQGFEKGNYYKNYVIPVKDFCEMSVELANTKLEMTFKSSKKLHLSNSPIGHYWLKVLPEQMLPLPTMHFPIRSSSDGKVARPYIVSTIETVDISSTGVSLPKIVTFRISDGLKRKVLMKGSNDDLRQDAIMEQVFGQVNKILQKDKQMRKLDLNISTYEVIPLGPNAGIIEHVAQSISLNQILVVFHRNDSISFDQARKKMKMVQNKSKDERIRTYDKLTEVIKPVLHNFFFDYFPEPQEWLNAKKTYTKGIAASSIVGHILGLGDRHLNNILLDYSTGKPIHIDLGVAFDQGRLLPIPELVPFRLTRDIIDGFGVTGVEGLFRRSCETTYSVLRENYAKVMCVLNILKWDPLYSWVMSPIRRHRHLLEEDSQIFGSISLDDGNSALEPEGNQESYRALKGVEDKLIGNGLSIEATIQELIQQATNVENLALIYMGWSPFY